MAAAESAQKAKTDDLCQIKEESDTLRIRLQGAISAKTVQTAWKEIFPKLEADSKKAVSIDASAVDYCDGSGIALIFELRTLCADKKLKCDIEGLKPRFQTLLDQFPKDGKLGQDDSKRDTLNLLENIGKHTVAIFNDWKAQMTFMGEALVSIRTVIRHPRNFRWRDAFVIAEKAGVEALPIVGMIGFLMGLIMAFQALQPLKQFGTEIFVVNLVALAMLRELGPIMTAIMLAGRSGSAFAAEIGTMKVNEEINALRTMGIEPVPFLALPRLLAGIAMTPILTLYASFIGIGGGLMVMMLDGHPWAELYHQLVNAVDIKDLLAGFFKSFVFGALVAGIGCLRGLQTASGATSVGDSTTRAVVSGIFLIVLTDAVFSFVYYALNI